MGNKTVQATVLIVATVLITAGCTNTVKNAEELKTYVNNPENGLIQQESGAGIDIKAVYRPTGLLVDQGLREDSNQEVVDSLRKKYQGHYYFIISYSKGGREALRHAVISQADYSAKLNVLSFGMNRYMRLATDNDTIPVKDYMYQNMFGAGRSTDVLFAFDKSRIKDTENISLVLDDIGFGTGRKVFTFKQEDLEDVPRIEYKRK